MCLQYIQQSRPCNSKIKNSPLPATASFLVCFRRLIVQYIEKFGAVSRHEIDVLLMDKLSDVLSEQQKKNKITNLLSYLRMHYVIKTSGKKKWVLV